MPDPSPWIVETTAETFERDVIQRSHELPVVVDFWAPWCHPCRMLGPALEKLAQEYAGKFVLVKANTDEMPQHASAFGVQGIPAVFALRGGKLVDAFVGVLPEAQIRQWLDRLQPSEAELLLEDATRLEATDLEGAIAKYRQVLEKSPDDAAAKIGLARALLAAGQVDECRQILADLESRGFLEPEAEKVRAQLTLSSAAEDAGDLQRLRQAVAEQPNDRQRKLQLAKALLGAGQYEEGLDLCLELVQIDRRGTGEEARKLMLDAFRVLGQEAEMTNTYQRRLSLALA